MNWPTFLYSADHNAVLDKAEKPKMLEVSWKFSAKGRFKASPIIYNNMLYLGSYDKNFYAIDINTSNIAWSVNTNSYITATALATEDSLFFGNWNNTFYCLNRETGTTLWTFKTNDVIQSAPVLVDGVVYFGSVDQNVYALDATTGTKKWSFKCSGYIYTTPTYYDGALYIGTRDGSFYAINTSNGSAKWNEPFQTKSPINSTASAVDNTVYFGCDDGQLFALGTNFGNMEWNYKTEGKIQTTPLIYDDKVFFGSSDRNFYAVDIYEHSLSWNYQADDQFTGSPILIADEIYCGNLDGCLYIFDAKSGSLKNKLKTGSEIESSPAYDGVNLFVSNNQNAVLCYSTPKEISAFSEAESLLNTGKTEEAIKKLEQAVSFGTNYTRAGDMLIELKSNQVKQGLYTAQSLLNEKKWDEAFAAYSKLVGLLTPTQTIFTPREIAGIYYGMGVISRQRNEPEKATAHFKLALQYDPDMRKCSEEISQIYLNSGNTTLALAELTKLASRYPQEPRYRKMTGDIYRQLKDYDKAFDEYRRASQVNKDFCSEELAWIRQYYIDVTEVVVQQFLEDGNFSGALKELKKIEKYDSKYVARRAAEIQKFFAEKKQEDITKLKKYSEIKTYFDAAKTLYQGGEIDKAAEYTEMVLEIDPENEEALKFLDTLDKEREEKKQNNTRILIGCAIISALMVALFFLMYKRRNSFSYLHGAGKKHFNANDLQKASEYLKNAARLEPSNTDVLKMLLEINIAAENFTEIFNILGRLIKLEPDCIDHQKMLADFYQKNGQVKKAIQCYQSLLNTSPSDSMLCSRLKDLYAQVGNYDEIIKLYTGILSKHPEIEENYFVLIDVYLKEGKYGDAITVYKQLFEHFPGLFSRIIAGINDIVSKSGNEYLGRTALADIYALQGNNNKAVEEYERVLELNTTDATTLQKLATLYEKIDKIENSIEACERLLKISPTYVIYEHLVNLYIKLNEYSNAVGMSAQILEKFPDKTNEVKQTLIRIKELSVGEFDVYRALGEVYEFINQQNDAIAEYNNALEIKEDPFIITKLGKIHLESENYTSALEYFNRLISMDPLNIDHNLLVADVYIAQKDLDKITSWLNELLSKIPGSAEAIIEKYKSLETLFPNNVKIHNELAQIYKLQKNLSMVRSEYEAILKNEPDNIDILSKVGKIYINQSKFKEAVDIFERLISLVPEQVEYQRILLTLYTETKDFDNAFKCLDRLKNQFGSTQKLINSYRKILSLDPANFLGRNLLAKLYCENNMVDKAIQQYENILNDDPVNQNASQAAIELYVSMNRIDAAIRVAKRKLRVEPDNIDSRFEYCDLLLKNHQYTEVAAEYEKMLWKYQNLEDKIFERTEALLKVDPKNITALLVLAKIHTLKDSVARAVECYNTVISLDPLNAKALRSTADILKKAGNYAEALRIYQKLSAIEIDDTEITHNIANLLLKTGELDKSFSIFEKLLENTQSSFDRDNIEKRVEYIKQKIVERTIQEYSLLLSSDSVPRDAKIILSIDDTNIAVKNSEKFLNTIRSNSVNKDEIQYLLGKAYFDNGDYEKAITIFQGMDKSAAQYGPEALLYEGISFIRQEYIDSGKNVFATINFDTITERTRKCEILYSIATIFEEIGDFDDSLEYFKKILSVDISYKDVKSRIDLSKRKQESLNKDKDRISYILGTRFKEAAEIGVGGMGKIYRARDTKSGNLVAIKVISEKYQENEKAYSRFIQRDGKAAAMLSHDNIIKIFEIVEDQKAPHIIMEFIDGESFREILQREKRIPLELIKEIAIQAGNALHYAHTSSVIHRDIKPDNIMLNRDGVIKIMDFGLARITTGTVMTETGETFGTLSYMAPEQINARPTDGRTDIFALGVTLYELLTGVLPFHGDNPGHTMYKILNEEPKPPSSVLPEISPEIDKIIMKCIAKNPDDRYKTAADMVNDFQEVN